jgi:hypothetical protein
VGLNLFCLFVVSVWSVSNSIMVDWFCFSLPCVGIGGSRIFSRQLSFVSNNYSVNSVPHVHVRGKVNRTSRINFVYLCWKYRVKPGFMGVLQGCGL